MMLCARAQVAMRRITRQTAADDAREREGESQRERRGKAARDECVPVIGVREEIGCDGQD